MKHLAIISFLAAGFFYAPVVMAAVSSLKDQKLTNRILFTDGSVRGGQAGTGFSLVGVKAMPSKNQQVERISLAMGNGAQRVLAGRPGYFNVELRPGQRQIVIDLPQTINSRYEEAQLKKVFSKSPFVQKTQLFFDPEGQSLSLVLDLKKKAGLRVIEVAGKKQQTAKLVLDLFEDKAVKSKPAKKVQKRKST